jgi:hypothetical protein
VFVSPPEIQNLKEAFTPARRGCFVLTDFSRVPFSCSSRMGLRQP